MAPPLLLLLPLLVAAGGRAAAPLLTEASDCHGVPAQSALDYHKMRGTWYVVEIAEHLPQGSPKGTTALAACPRMDVGALTPPPDVHMRLRWHEGHQHVNYDLRLPEPHTHRGYWLVEQPQNGSLTTSDKYRQFEGAVMVMKATAAHFVLTFCSLPSAERHVYSLVMAREPALPPHDLLAINAMLVNRGLPQTALRRTCKDFPRGGAARPARDPLQALALALALALAARAP